MVDKVQKPEVNFFLSDESSTVLYRTDVDKNVSNDPSSVFLNFHESIQHLQQKSLLFALVYDFLNHAIKFSNVQKQ